MACNYCSERCFKTGYCATGGYASGGCDCICHDPYMGGLKSEREKLIEENARLKAEIEHIRIQNEVALEANLAFYKENLQLKADIPCPECNPQPQHCEVSGAKLDSETKNKPESDLSGTVISITIVPNFDCYRSSLSPETSLKVIYQDSAKCSTCDNSKEQYDE